MEAIHSDFLFNELKSIHKAIQDTSAFRKDNYYLDDLIDEILKLHNVTRRCGLLDLEDAVRKLTRGSDFPKHLLNFLADMFGFIIDGVDGELVRRFGILCYINETSANVCQDEDRLAYIIVIYAVEYIQDGYNPRLAESMLKALLPIKRG